MPKTRSFSMRVLSVILALLITLSMTTIGVTTVAAREFDSTFRLFVGNVRKGDIFAAGATLLAKNEHGFITYHDYNKITLYINGEVYGETETSITFDRPVVMTGIERDRSTVNSLLLYFDSLDAVGKVNTEEALRTAITVGGTVDLAGDIVLDKTLAIADGKEHVINTNGYSMSLIQDGPAIIALGDASTLTITGNGEAGGSALTGSAKEGSGCAVSVNRNSKLIMKGMTVIGNKRYNGGGICVENGTVELTKCKFENNIAFNQGGGLYLDANSTGTLTECEFSGNQAIDGGAIANEGTLTAYKCKLSGNIIGTSGGGIWSHGTATLTKTEITDNTNAVNGGGVTNLKDMTLKECTISNNSASGSGGGVFINTGGKTAFEGANLISGNAANVGGGFCVEQGNVTVTKSTLTENKAKEAGGAMWANTGTTVTFTDAKLDKNSCGTNGGTLNSHGTLNLTGSTITAGVAENTGGGVYMDTGGTLTVSNSEITGCQAYVSGGGVYFHAGTLNLAGGKIKIIDSTGNGRTDNIHFNAFKTIQVSGKLTVGSQIGFVPPANSDKANVTSGYGDYNKTAPASYFTCDTNEYRVNREEGLKEVNLDAMVNATNSTYKIQVTVRVTDDVDTWDWAKLNIYGRSDRGKGDLQGINTSHDFHESIDDDGESYTYEYDCGPDYFPCAVDFITHFGDIFPREFQADVTIKINNVNVATRHVVHQGTGSQERNTLVEVGGDKYPCPEEFIVDAPKEIDTSAVITISAADQYGMIWTANDSNARMESISFPEEDTFEPADSSGFKWRLSSNKKSKHMSTYHLIFKTASNVYPEITKAINVTFVFPLYLSVIIDGEEVFSKTGSSNETIKVPVLETPPGYYILKWESTGACNKKVDKKDKSVEVKLLNESVTLTAKLNPINYYVSFDNNGDDVTGSLSRVTANYNKELKLSNSLIRRGYTLVGWNTQADGMGTMFPPKGPAINLTTIKGDKVTLYAIWKPDQGSASTSASIFSDGTTLLYVGAGILLAAIVAAVIYSVFKKKKEKRKE